MPARGVELCNRLGEVAAAAPDEHVPRGRVEGLRCSSEIDQIEIVPLHMSQSKAGA